MAMLTAALDSPPEARARSLFFEGAAGTGKSALLAWARADARRRGRTVLAARASALEAANDFGVMRQVLATLRPPPEGRPAAALSPTPQDSSPFEVFERVSGYLLDAASRDPVLIAVDDLQWSDVSSLRWLAYLANRSAGRRSPSCWPVPRSS